MSSSACLLLGAWLQKSPTARSCPFETSYATPLAARIVREKKNTNKYVPVQYITVFGYFWQRYEKIHSLKFTFRSIVNSFYCFECEPEENP